VIANASIGIWEEAVVHILRYGSRICLEGLRNTTKVLTAVKCNEVLSWEQSLKLGVNIWRIRNTRTCSLGWHKLRCIRQCIQKFPFRTGCLEQKLQMVQLSATRYSCIAILWVSLVSFAATTLCVASQRVFIVVVYFVMTRSEKFWIYTRLYICWPMKSGLHQTNLLLTYLLTYSKLQNIIWKTDSHSACESIYCFLYGTRMFITVFTKARHWALSWANRIQFVPSIECETIMWLLMLNSWYVEGNIHGIFEPFPCRWTDRADATISA
jgi:hypothetical protein